MNGSRYSGIALPPWDFPSLMYIWSTNALEMTIPAQAPIPDDVRAVRDLDRNAY
jgi:hypothetical protein